MKTYLHKIFSKNKPEDPLDKMEVFIFVLGVFQVGNALLFYDETNLIGKIGFWFSIIAAVLFIVLAFIVRRKPKQIIIVSMVLYSLFIALNCVDNHSTLFRLILPYIIFYFVFIKTLKDINNTHQ